MKKSVFHNFAKITGKHLCQGLFFNKVAGLKACNFIKKDTQAQVSSCEFWKIFKKTFFYRTPSVVVSEGMADDKDMILLISELSQYI